MDDLLDKAPCGFLRLADNGTILIANTTIRTLLGYDRASLEGVHIDTLLTPGARIFYQTHVFPLLRVQSKVEEVYLSMRSGNGADVPVLLNAARHEEGGVGVSDWIIVVMRRRNQFENELLQAKKAAEEANRTKARFLSMLSHDLRAPLSGISMAAQILATGAAGPVTERQRSELERIKSASQYVLRLVKDLLNYARLQSGRVAVKREPVVLAVVLAQSKAMISHLMEEANLSFDLGSPPSDLAVCADPDRLQQVILNLLSNAVKFTDPGGDVAILCERQGDQVLLKIRDTGRGIPADRLEQIFSPFTQIGASVSRDGSVGLGLAISRELVRSMGGDLTVESKEGHGSTFTISLDMAEPE